MTDAEILTLVDKLENCELPKTDFHHRDHLAVAVFYLMTSDLDSAVARMRCTLRAFAAHHGVGGLYHETLTRFWLTEVEKCVDRNGCLGESVRRTLTRLTDKNLPAKYYSKERIESQEARENWIEPDLAAKS